MTLSIIRQLRNLATLSAVLILSLSCRETPKSEDPGEGQQDTLAVTVPAPKDIIAIDEAQKLYDTYSERRVPLIERFEIPDGESGPFNAARFTSFDYKTLKEYLAFIEQEAAGANVDITSLRLYFGNYPADSGQKSGNTVSSARRNTIFIVPTLEKNGEDFGFYIQTGEDGKREAVLLVERGVPASSTGDSETNPASRAYAGFLPMAKPAMAGEQSLILNRGNSGPPPNADF